MGYDMTAAAVFGAIAGICTTGAFVPQMVRVVRLWSAHDFSWWWLAVFLPGLTFWIIKGGLTGDATIILANLGVLVMVLVITYVKARPHRKGIQPPNKTPPMGKPSV